jgi:menaquinone-dependent protoporphyrinogen oxidase
MSILVAYASRHGATRAIAERIAERIRVAGLEADACPVQAVRNPGAYDAFVVGGAAYMFHWLKEATTFVRRNRAVLASKPVWLFSSGPIGTDLVDKEGQDVLVASVPREFAELRDAVHPRGERVFFGAFNPAQKAVGLTERFVMRMPAARAAFPAGDFRDWPEIEAWADAIACELTPSVIGAR